MIYYFILGFLLVISFIIGMKTDSDLKFKNLITFLKILSASFFISLFSQYIIEFAFFIIEFSGSFILETVKNFGLVEEGSQFFPTYFEMSSDLIHSFGRFFIFVALFTFIYFIIFIIRITKLLKNDIKNKMNDYKNGVTFAIEALIVFTIVLSPISIMVNYFSYTNNSIQTIANNENYSVCDVVETREIFNGFCNLMGKQEKNWLIKTNSNLFYNQIITHTLTRGESSEMQLGLEEISHFEIIFEAKIYRIILIDDFDFFNFNEYDIDFNKFFSETHKYIEANSMPHYLMPFYMDLFNGVMKSFYENSKEEYPSLSYETLKYDLNNFEKEFLSILDLMEFIDEIDLFSLMDLVSTNPSLNDITTIINHLVDQGAFNLSTFLKLSEDLSNLRFFQIMENHIETSGFMSFVGWFNKTIVTALYVATGLIAGANMFLAEFRQTEIYYHIRHILFSLRDARLEE